MIGFIPNVAQTLKEDDVPLIHCSTSGGLLPKWRRLLSPGLSLFFALLIFHRSKANQLHRRAIWKLGHQVKVAAHAFDTAAQGGNQQIGALFELGNALLPDTQGLGEFLLREFAGVTKLPECHLFCNQRCGALLDPLSLRGRQILDDVIYVSGHNYSLSFFSRTR